MDLETELQKCLGYLQTNWGIQTNKDDQNTNFIYNCNTVDEVIRNATQFNTNINYALHRWYNFKTSLQVEQIFCKYGAIKEQNPYNHDIDIYIQNIPFDVKLTVYPKQLPHTFNLYQREDKDAFINWYYNNQSQENRKQVVNRLYVVVDRMELKANKTLIEPRIANFMTYTHNNGLRQLFIKLDDTFYKIYADLIYIKG